MRVGIIVNPDAGLGGKLGFKGSDGRAEEARAAGAQDRAGPRMEQCMNKFTELLASGLNRTKATPEIITWSGRMGSSWLGENEFTSIGQSPEKTSANDTSKLITSLLENKVDIILYAGGKIIF